MHCQHARPKLPISLRSTIRRESSSSIASADERREKEKDKGEKKKKKKDKHKVHKVHTPVEIGHLGRATARHHGLLRG